MYFMPGRLRALTLSLLVLLFCLGGCATTSQRDPLEPMNRAVYRFNDVVDSAIISPIAKGYRAVLPSFVRTGISNFFANIGDVLVALNNLLQGKVVNALSDVGRVLVNTTIGIGGLFDVATPIGLERHNEDFGQTLGYWGIGDGPYLMLPLLGPSSLRDAFGTLLGTKLDPVGYVTNMRLRNSLWGSRLLNTRAELLDTSKILETASLDPYEFLRDAYLQRRRNLVFDGTPPREKFDDDEPPAKPPAAAPPVKPEEKPAPAGPGAAVPPALTVAEAPEMPSAATAAPETTVPDAPAAQGEDAPPAVTATAAEPGAKEPAPTVRTVVRVWPPAAL